MEAFTPYACSWCIPLGIFPVDSSPCWDPRRETAVRGNLRFDLAVNKCLGPREIHEASTRRSDMILGGSAGPF